MFEKKIVTAALVLLSFAQSLTAQDFSFDEVTYSPEQTTFKLFAPKNAKRVEVTVTDAKTKKMKFENGIWTTTLKGDLKNRYYTFQVTDRKAHGATPGVFAKAVGVNGKMGAIIDLRETDPQGWAQDQRPYTKSPADLVI